MSDAFYLDKSDPASWKALNGLALKVREATEAAGLPRSLVELLNVRISQINSCAYCLDMHSRLALEAGESDDDVLDGGTIFAEGMDANLYTLGVSAPLGAGKVMASWAMADFDDRDGFDAEKQNIYSIGYTYNLSKRTNVYAIGSYAKNLYGIDDTKSTVAGIGLRHQF